MIRPLALAASTLLLVSTQASGLSAQDVVAAVAKKAAGTKAASATDGVARPIDFARISRKIGKLPDLQCKKPLYGLLLFGLNGEHRVWAVFDKSSDNAEGEAYDVLYLDRNADGDLTGDDERFVGKIGKYGRDKAATFEVGDFLAPGQKPGRKDQKTGKALKPIVHTQFEVRWTKASVRVKMLWRGEKISYGVYGPQRATYQNFASSPAKAPILIPGYDRPFEFQHWMCDKMRRGGSTDFKVFVGNRGDRTGAFMCARQDFLPKDEHVLATLIYEDTQGKLQHHQVKLTERC